MLQVDIGDVECELVELLVLGAGLHVLDLGDHEVGPGGLPAHVVGRVAHADDVDLADLELLEVGLEVEVELGLEGGENSALDVQCLEVILGRGAEVSDLTF